MTPIERAARSKCREIGVSEDRWREWPPNVGLAGRQLRFAIIDLLIAMPWPFRALGHIKLEQTP